MNNDIIRALGYIIKKESLATHKTNLHFSEMVLEDMSPFPGYYDFYTVPQHKRELIPRSVFIIIKSYEGKFEDDFIRLTQRIKNHHPELKFDAVFGQITLFNAETNCIRLKLENYALIPEIIRLYQEGGIVFAKHKEIKEFQTIIKVRKYLEMKMMDNNIYHDLTDPHMFYIMAPCDVPWDNFESIIKNIRVNYEYKYFDAAKGCMYLKPGLIDFVRIYSQEIDLPKLQYLRDKLTTELERASS